MTMLVDLPRGLTAHVEYHIVGLGYTYSISLVGVVLASGWVRVPDPHMPQNEQELHRILTGLIAGIDTSEIAP